MASFLTAEDVDAKFDARCSAYYSGPRRRMIHSLQAYEALGLSKTLDEEVFILPRWIEGPVLDVNVPLLSRRGRVASLAKMFAVSAYIYATRNFAHETGICLLGYRRPDCNIIAEQGGGPDARPSWAGSGPRAEGCPPMM